MKKVFKVLGVLLVCFIAIGALSVDTTKAVIHHTASGDVSVHEIDKWHKERGWDGIGYHFVIRANGSVEEGRDITKLGAHAKGRNHYLGIALTGYDTFTQKQYDALKRLIKKLGITHIENHHEHCPSDGIDLARLAKELSISFKAHGRINSKA